MGNDLSRFLEDLDKCVRCGSCKAVCPTHNQEPLEPMGARGRIMLLRALISGQAVPSPLMNERIFNCILCGACSSACPLGMDVGEAIYRGRELLCSTDKGRNRLRSAAKLALRRPGLTFRLLRTGRPFLLKLVKRGTVPFLPDLPRHPLGREQQVFKVSRKKGRVAVFTGCSVNYLFPALAESLIHVLHRFGYEVVLPKGEVCCGAPLRALGLGKEAAGLARKNLGVFSRLNVEAVLSLCPTCTDTLKNGYRKLIGTGLDNAADISVFFRDKLTPMKSIGKTSVYHDPCHLRYGLGIRKEPRDIIRKAGIGLAETDSSGCCGFGGPFCFSARALSGKLLEKRTAEITRAGADAVVTSCPGCILQLTRTIGDRPVLHLVELIEEAYCLRAPENEEIEVQTAVVKK
ncbi:MAG: (Fe-S)-binding protein [Candidatus Sulfobium sp.]|jgi:glycolate oxidase iron-sulfur subunit